MHISGTPLTVSAAYFSATQEEQLQAAREARLRRKRLLNASDLLADETVSEEDFLLHHWLDAAEDSPSTLPKVSGDDVGQRDEDFLY